MANAIKEIKKHGARKRKIDKSVKECLDHIKKTQEELTPLEYMNKVLKHRLEKAQEK
jgi:hypothetical protein